MRQQALLDQWLASGYLLAFSGLFSGLFMSLGLAAGVALALCLIVLAPVMLSMISAAVRRYRLASLFSFAGFALCSLLAVALLVAPLDGYPLLEQIARSAAGAVCAALIAMSAAASWASARALWGVPRSPQHLGPGGAVTKPIPLPAPGPERADAALPPAGRRIQYAGT